MANFIADSADVYGDVTLGEGSTIWFQSVLRGDSNTISIGKMTNVQDGTVVHVDHDAPTVINDWSCLHYSWLYDSLRGADRHGGNCVESCRNRRK